jgi:hypothetical protein
MSKAAGAPGYPFTFKQLDAGGPQTALRSVALRSLRAAPFAPLRPDPIRPAPIRAVRSDPL